MADLLTRPAARRPPAPDRLTARIGSGAFAGVLTTPSNAAAITTTSDAVARQVRPADGVLFYGMPAGSLLVVRALPPAAAADSATLGRDLDAALGRLLPEPAVTP